MPQPRIPGQPNPVDVHVGSRIAHHRKAAGLSQEKLGQQLGVTFQQVQKYEKGMNRVGASRLHALSKALGVPVSALFAGLEQSTPKVGANDTLTALPSAEGIELMRAYVRISDATVRRQVLRLVQAIAKG